MQHAKCFVLFAFQPDKSGISSFNAIDKCLQQQQRQRQLATTFAVQFA